MTSYYYETMASIYNCHVVGVRPLQTAPNVSLTLFFDSGFSLPIKTSERGMGALEWVAYKRSGAVYPKVYVGLGSDAWARVQWDGAFRLYEREVVTNLVNETDFIDTYAFSLFYTKTYVLTLTIPATGDYDLYLYALETDEAAGPDDYERKSATNGSGLHEEITDYSPTSATGGDHVAVITWVAGNGTYSFTFEQAGGDDIPGFSWVGGALSLLIIPLLRKVGARRRRLFTA